MPLSSTSVTQPLIATGQKFMHWHGPDVLQGDLQELTAAAHSLTWMSRRERGHAISQHLSTISAAWASSLNMGSCKQAHVQAAHM
jgi:hypothetical protein